MGGFLSPSLIESLRSKLRGNWCCVLHDPNIHLRVSFSNCRCVRPCYLGVAFLAITSTLQNQHRTFLRLANKAADLNAELEEMKNSYREIYRTKTGSKRDPFEGGISALDIS